jgi:hypothetical protein
VITEDANRNNETTGLPDPQSRRHELDWVTATNTMRYRPYGETTWGAGVVLSADNDHLVPLFSADGTKWIWLTVDFATLDPVADFNTTSDATGLLAVPSHEMTGIASLLHPTQRVFGNLSATDPTATGDTLTMSTLWWILEKLLEASGGDPSRCAIATSLQLKLKSRSVLAAAAQGEVIKTWMGREVNEIGIGGVPILNCSQMVNNRTAPSATGLGRLVGVVFGDKDSGVHLRYGNNADQPGISMMPGFEQNGMVETKYSDDVPMPYQHYMILPDKTDQKTRYRAYSYIEASTAKFASVSEVDALKLT